MNKLNLLFLDPYCGQVQCCLFKSSTYYDREIFEQNDFLITSVIQSTMCKKRDNNFKTYIWTQFEQNLVRSMMLRGDTEDGCVDSDAADDKTKLKANEFVDEFE